MFGDLAQLPATNHGKTVRWEKIHAVSEEGVAFQGFRHSPRGPTAPQHAGQAKGIYPHGIEVVESSGGNMPSLIKFVQNLSNLFMQMWASQVYRSLRMTNM